MSASTTARDGALVAPGELEAMLDRLGLEAAAPSAGYLARVQRRWALTQPFHNLDLLADFARGAPPLDRRGGWLRCLAGLGGPCHVQASSFLALLRGLGFEAHFAAATISHPGDHLVVCARLGSRRWICDVGNGHPYLVPFSLDGPTDQAHLGWSVRSRVEADGALFVEQRTAGRDDWRPVYRATDARRRWADFEDAIARHHRDPGFGPFLTGLRAIRVRADVAHTLRDDALTTHTAAGVQRVMLDDEHEAVLEERLGLGALPVRAAVAAWRRHTGQSA